MLVIEVGVANPGARKLIDVVVIATEPAVMTFDTDDPVRSELVVGTDLHTAEKPAITPLPPVTFVTKLLSIPLNSPPM